MVDLSQAYFLIIVSIDKVLRDCGSDLVACHFVEDILYEALWDVVIGLGYHLFGLGEEPFQSCLLLD